MNRKNLNRMADYIETIPQEKFNMATYRTGELLKHECDTVGCVLGHCTILDKRPLPILRSGNINFYAWSIKFTGLGPFSNEWRYLFASGWGAVDNTPIGAANRIRHFLEKGLPTDRQTQMLGRAPLSYIK